MSFSHEMYKDPECKAEFLLPPNCILHELLHIHLLLPQGSKRRATLHQAFASNVQLDLPHNCPDGPTPVVLRLALISHEV